MWYIRRLDSLINPRNPRPYYAGYGPGSLAPKQVFWAELEKDAIEFPSEDAASDEAARMWADWRALVRIVRAEEE